MQREVYDFIHGFSESVVNGLHTQKHGIEEDIGKSKNKLLVIVASIILAGTGIFMTIWGIASYIDQRFSMQGLGFVLVGIIVTLAGTVISTFKRR